MNYKTILITFISLIAVNAWIMAAEVSDGNSGVKTHLISMGSIEAGQFVKSEIPNKDGSETPLERQWYQKAYMRMGFSAEVNERTKLSFVGEGMVRNAYDLSKDKIDDNKPFYSFYPYNLSISYAFGDIGKPWLKIGAGVIPFKYNSDVRNLGEYLFRTNTYPPTMRNQFDQPLARLTGFQITSSPVDSLNIDVMLTTESQVLPLQDFSPSLIADYTFLKAFTAGAGIVFSHLWSVNESYTTPTDSLNQVKNASGQWTGDYYTFRGTKLMGRLAIDLKTFLPWHSIFGDNDLRLYTEAAILGLQNQGTYYDNIWRRMPFMVGFNVPAFKLLDVFSVELEWYNWNYRNSYSKYLLDGMLPIPDEDKPVSDWKDNSLKWSIYTKRTIGHHFSIIGQIAYDHMMIERNIYMKQETYFCDAMHKHGDWAWVFKTQWDL